MSVSYWLLDIPSLSNVYSLSAITYLGNVYSLSATGYSQSM